MKRRKKIQKSKLILVGVIYVFFTTGYILGIQNENKKLKQICSEYLQINIEDIKSVKYKDNSLVIDLYSIDEDLSIENRNIYDRFDPELVLDLKDRVKKQNIKVL